MDFVSLAMLKSGFADKLNHGLGARHIFNNSQRNFVIPRFMYLQAIHKHHHEQKIFEPVILK